MDKASPEVTVTSPKTNKSPPEVDMASPEVALTPPEVDMASVEVAMTSPEVDVASRNPEYESRLVSALRSVVLDSTWQQIGSVADLRRKKCRKLYAEDGEHLGKIYNNYNYII